MSDGSPLDLSAMKGRQSASKDPTHNLSVVTVVRSETDPLVCPEMSTPQLLIAPPAFQGGPPQFRVETILMACIGKHCAKWSPSKKACGAAKF